MNVRIETQIIKNLDGPTSVRTRETGEGAPPWVTAEPTAKHIVQQRIVSNKQKVLENDTQTFAEVRAGSGGSLARIGK